MDGDSATSDRLVEPVQRLPIGEITTGVKRDGPTLSPPRPRLWPAAPRSLAGWALPCSRSPVPRSMTSEPYMPRCYAFLSSRTSRL
jgi:hypothetical protein